MIKFHFCLNTYPDFLDLTQENVLSFDSEFESLDKIKILFFVCLSTCMSMYVPHDARYSHRSEEDIRSSSRTTNTLNSLVVTVANQSYFVYSLSLCHEEA